MAHQFPPQHHAQTAQVSQHQNIGQQRQAPMMPQQGPAVGPQRGVQGQPHIQNPFANYDPQLALFTFEKPKGAESWEDVEAEQQYVTVQDLQNDLKRFQRNKGSVKRSLNEIPSANCRRLINELVEEQNRELMCLNRTLQWNIASIDIDWKTVNRRQRQLRRVSVILQTGPSGYEDPAVVRTAATMATRVQPMQQSQAFAHQANHTAQEIPQPSRNPQHTAQSAMGHTQQPAPPMRAPQPHVQTQSAQGPPPPPPGMAHPPPPPPGMAHPPPHPPPGMAHPPPPPGMAHLPPPPHGAASASPFSHPPPGAVRGVLRQPTHGQQEQQQQQQQQARTMPGTYPETNHRSTTRPGQHRVEALDPSSLKAQKRSKNRHDESSSESDSEEWESETGDSGSDRFRVRHVENGEFAHIGKPKRGRSRQSSRSKKFRHNKSHNKVRSRSRSHVRTEHRRRRDSDLIDPPPIGKHSPMSSMNSSPRSSKQQLPPIHIHMNTPATEKPIRANERVRRDSHNSSSPDYRKEKFMAEPMSRGSSWDRHSGTASFNDNSSIHTADDSVFSEPERHKSGYHRSDIVDRPTNLRSRNLPPRQENYGRPHPSHIYDDIDHRQPKRGYSPPNDYPYNVRHRDPYQAEHAYAARPGLDRRNSIQVPQSNPFDTTRYPPRPSRAMSYAADTHEPMFPRREQQYLPARPMRDTLQLDELAEAIEHIKDSRRKPLDGYARRGSEWDGRYERDVGEYNAYDRRRY